MLVMAVVSIYMLFGFFRGLLSAELMLSPHIVKCRSLVKQCGGAVWTIFEGSAFEDILGEREKFFKPALALFGE